LRSSENTLCKIIEDLPKKLVGQLMTGMDDILRGKQSLSGILQQCTEGLPEEEGKKVLEEFALKFVEKAREFLAHAVLQDENWKRLETLSLDDLDIADIERPENIVEVKRRLSEQVEMIKKYYPSTAAIADLANMITN
jgi:hypothetical protein